jgi:exodeoxyribonuclease VII large subunit
VPDRRNLSLDFTPRPAQPAVAEPAASARPGAAASESTVSPLSSDSEHPMTVAALDRAIKGALDASFSVSVWVEGEVTGMRAAPSGHLYFGLKDEHEDASVDVVVYRSNVAPRARTLCVDGARVRLHGKPTFWAPRGRLQLVADRVQAAGRGALLEALERLKAKLAAEGLFAEERKRPLPTDPRIVGVVTSATGAVIHDICRVAFRRGGARILLAPALVQGSSAPEAICRALRDLSRVAGVDVIVVGRGGGSADDLSAFNDEAVVRAVAACPVPVVSAVGHDVDVTLVDFVSDARAATPSQAAEMLVPDSSARTEVLRRTRLHLARAVSSRIDEDRVVAARLQGRLGDPRLALASHQQLLDDQFSRLSARARASLARRRDLLARSHRSLAMIHPREVLARQRGDSEHLRERLVTLWRTARDRRVSRLEQCVGRLDAMSPLKVLARGYAIAARADGRAVRAAADVHPGDRLTVRVDHARIDAEVCSVEVVGEER